MHTYLPNPTGSEIRVALHAPSAISPPTNALSLQIASRYSSHGRAALATALDGGLMPDEVGHILAGRRVVDAFPVQRGEGPDAYAARAVSEMFVTYLR